MQSATYDVLDRPRRLRSRRREDRRDHRGLLRRRHRTSGVAGDPHRLVRHEDDLCADPRFPALRRGRPPGGLRQGHGEGRPPHRPRRTSDSPRKSGTCGITTATSTTPRRPRTTATARPTPRTGPTVITPGRIDQETDDAMTRSEEELRVGKQREATGTVRLRKYVVTEQQQMTVPVQREEVRVEREPITEDNVDDAMRGPDISEAEHEVTTYEERPVVYQGDGAQGAGAPGEGHRHRHRDGGGRGPQGAGRGRPRGPEAVTMRRAAPSTAYGATTRDIDPH